jgi:hypothetical protein
VASKGECNVVKQEHLRKVLELLVAAVTLVLSAEGYCFPQTPGILRQEPIPSYLSHSSHPSVTPNTFQQMPRQEMLELPKILRGCWRATGSTDSVEVLDPSMGRPGSSFTSTYRICYLQREGSGKFELSSSESTSDTNNLHFYSSIDSFLLSTGLAAMKREVTDDRLEIISADGESHFTLHHHIEYAASASALFGLLSGSQYYVGDSDLSCWIESPDPKSMFYADAQGNVQVNPTQTAPNRQSVHCAEDGTTYLGGREWLREKGHTEMNRVDDR